MKTSSLKKNQFKRIPFTIYLSLGFILITGLKCKKENLNALPPATMSGENTMGGYIDGKLFVSRRLDLLSQDPGGTYNPSIPLLGFSGGSSFDPDGPTFGFSIKENLKKGKIIFSQGGVNTGLLTIRGSNGTLIYYYLNSGYLEFTRFDTNERVFSGNFDVTYKSESGNTIHVTDGRFDLKTK